MMVNSSNFIYDDSAVANNEIYKIKLNMPQNRDAQQLSALDESLLSAPQIPKSDGVMTHFKEAGSGEIISVSLSDENIQKLKNFFGDDEVYSGKSGYVLSGVAEAYVAGWFANIAYERGYASGEPKGYVNTHVEIYALGDESAVAYVASAGFVAGKMPQDAQVFANGKDTIEGELNDMLAKDANTDGVLSFSEFAPRAQQREFFLNVAKKQLADFDIKDAKTPALPPINPSTGKAQMSEEDIKMAQLLAAQLKALSAGEAALTQDEKELIRHYDPKFLKELKELENGIKDDISAQISLDVRA